MQTQLIKKNLFSFEEIQKMSYFDFKYYGNRLLDQLIQSNISQ